MNQASQWLVMWQSEEISDEVLADHIAELVGSRDGSRGFFVVAMTSEIPLMDRLPEPLVSQLRLAGPMVVDLTVRNLAMSSAMQVEHGRSGDAEKLEGSMRVQRRCRDLLQVLDPELVVFRLETMKAATEGSGDDLEFLSRWNYDFDQRQAIKESIDVVLREMGIKA